jgi:molybdate transport system substrate-binding protein
MSKKSWSRLLTVVALCASVSGCHSAQPPAEPSGNTQAASDAASATTTTKKTITVAAASDLKFALDEVLITFQKRHPDIEVRTTYGASGNFFTQLSNRAPFDIYFSADIGYPRQLIEQGLADGSSEFLYAEGRIVVWARNESPLDLEKRGIESLLDASVKKIAIANPLHAPYGRAAEAALKSLNVYDRVKDRLVLGENIAQTAQFVESGAADVGIIALSLAMAPAMKDKGRFWMVPTDAYPKLEQGGVILEWSKAKDAANTLRSFVMGTEGREILESYGFEAGE